MLTRAIDWFPVQITYQRMYRCVLHLGNYINMYIYYIGTCRTLSRFVSRAGAYINWHVAILSWWRDLSARLADRFTLHHTWVTHYARKMYTYIYVKAYPGSLSAHLYSWFTKMEAPNSGPLLNRSEKTRSERCDTKITLTSGEIPGIPHKLSL